MPVIESRLDVDFYKFTMLQVIFNLHSDVKVKFAFTNRMSDIRLADIIPIERLREELKHAQSLRFMRDEITYLEEQKIFEPHFLHWMLGHQLPEISVEVEDGQFRIEVEGRWADVTLWETITLSIVNELYYEYLLDDAKVAWKEGVIRLEDKCNWFAQKKYRNIIFSEFGTRRRFSREWQDYVVATLGDKFREGLLPGFLGPSNVFFAKKHGLQPRGTFAHEMYMVYSGIYHDSDETIRGSHNRVLEDWWDAYGEPLSFALTDTYGSDFFFRDMTVEQAQKWKYLRQDSGNPFEDARKAIAFYEGIGIDPRAKNMAFSDGLNKELVCALYLTFKDKIGTVFGIGTYLTNDLGHKALSIVMKAVESNGHSTVKLSNNPAKATGPADAVERFKRIFGHTEGEYVECTY